MKMKWMLPVGLALAAVVTMLFGGIEESPVTVSVMTLLPTAVEETVSCNGTVEAGDAVMVSLPISFVADEVLVEVGQAVKMGDVLFRVNKEATKVLQQTGGRMDGALALSAVPAEVTAPQDGIVLSVDVALGNVMQQDVPCVALATHQGVQVRLMIREKNLPQLAVGQRVRVSGAGFDKTQYEGILQDIAATASVNATSGERTVQGIVRLDDGQADWSMRLGLSTKSTIIVNTIERALVIPHEAVKQTVSGEPYVYVVLDGRAVKTAISVVEDLSQGVLVSGDDLVGKQVVLQPDLLPFDGVLVQEAVA